MTDTNRKLSDLVAVVKRLRAPADARGTGSRRPRASSPSSSKKPTKSWKRWMKESPISSARSWATSSSR